MAKKAAVKKKTTKRAKTSEDDINQLFKELSEKFGESAPQPYRMTGDYAVNIAIEHPKFGVGYVFAAAPQKIDVAFKDTNRSLVQNRK